MLESVFLALFAAGWVVTLILFGLRREAEFMWMINIAIWVAVAYGAQGIDVVSNDGTIHTFQETTVTALAVGMVGFGVLSLILSLFGAFESSDTGNTGAGDVRDKINQELGD